MTKVFTANDGSRPEGTEPDVALETEANGAEPPKAPSTAKVKVTISGEEIEVDESVAALLQKREQEYARKLNSTSQELGDLRQFKSSHEDKKPVESTDSNLADQLFTDPEAVFTKFRADIEDEITRKVEAKYEIDQFWRKFYDVNSDLRDFRMEVNGILTNHKGELYDLPLEQMSVELAKRTREYIISRAKSLQVSSTKTKSNRGIEAEPPSTVAAVPAPKPAPVSTKWTTADILKARATARRVAREKRKPQIS